uniref:Uncharacterized protein n=1 Tax=Erythrolobus madagascarensis TaxID=708628 RepID=A0A7S0XIH7_9RHOD|mmetsp:Transcript_1477/g.3088  ORF Transcript_1477/g.3088 Transcript_1477/m.3088 type:complete len:672 (+) Transcript_1477:200-2215(+)
MGRGGAAEEESVVYKENACVDHKQGGNSSNKKNHHNQAAMVADDDGEDDALVMMLHESSRAKDRSPRDARPRYGSVEKMASKGGQRPSPFSPKASSSSGKARLSGESGSIESGGGGENHRGMMRFGSDDENNTSMRNSQNVGSIMSSPERSKSLRNSAIRLSRLGLPSQRSPSVRKERSASVRNSRSLSVRKSQSQLQKSGEVVEEEDVKQLKEKRLQASQIAAVVEPEQVRVVKMGSSAHLAVAPRSSSLRPSAAPSQRLPSAAMAGTAEKTLSIRYKKMVDSISKEPALILVPYGKGDAASDVVSFRNNALKRELQDLYYMLSSMQKRLFDLTHDEIDDFLRWSELFYTFVAWLFESEETLLFEFVSRIVGQAQMNALPAALDPPARAIAKKELHAMLDDLLSVADTPGFANLPAGEALPRLTAKVDKLVPALLRYVELQAEHLSAALRTAGVKDSDRVEFENDMFAQLRGMRTKSETRDYFEGYEKFDWQRHEGHLIFHLLLRPLKIEDDAVANSMRKRYLNPHGGGGSGGGKMRILGGLKSMKVKKEYEASKEEFKTDHVNIVRSFYKRWNTAHRTVESAPFASTPSNTAEVMRARTAAATASSQSTTAVSPSRLGEAKNKTAAERSGELDMERAESAPPPQAQHKTMFSARFSTRNLKAKQAAKAD